MSKRLKIWIAVAMSVLVLMLGAAIVGIAQGASPDPVLSIDYSNLSFRDAVYLKYAVKAENADASTVKLKVWSEEDYLAGNEPTAVLSSVATEQIDGQEYLIFDYKDLAAKQMTDNVYAQACVEIDGTIYSSEVNKNSILQYAYDKLGKTGVASTNENFKTFLTDMLQYGASAQKYFDYKADRPANADFYQVKPVGGTLPDGFTNGLYLAGDSVTVTAPETNEEGFPFSHWEDSAGNPIGYTATYSLTVGSQNEIYTAVYRTSFYSEGLAFTSNGDGTCTLAGIGECTDVNIIVPPASPIGEPVTSVGYQAFQNCTSLTSIVLPESIKNIEMRAFQGCRRLSSVMLPDGVETIENWAFTDCYVLSNFKIPGSVKVIGGYAFQNCKNLTSITIPEGVKIIGQYTFANCTGLASVTLPESITSIENLAFYLCSNLTSITIPKNVTSIDNSSFYVCNKLIEVCNNSALSNSQIATTALHVYKPSEGGVSRLHTTADGYVFYEDGETVYLVEYQGADTALVLPSDWNGKSYEILHHAFDGRRTITSVTFSAGVTKIGNGAFNYCTRLTNVIIPNGVTSIEGSAFYGCSKLTSIAIPNSVTSIGESAFSDCSNLTSIAIPDSVTSIGQAAFSGCTGLTSITIPKNVADISYSAFYGCSKLASISIPEGVTSIGPYAFLGCEKLTSITIPSSVTSIGYSAFDGCTGLTSITIPESVTSIGGYAFQGCSQLIQTEDGVSYVDKWVIGCDISVTSASLRNNTVGIGESAFYNCSNLTSVTIPESVRSIGHNAFGGCSNLTSVTIPSSVTNIGPYAFSDCSNLTSISIPDSVTNIGESAFYNCSKLTSITIPNSVTSIGTWAFYNCNNITIYADAIEQPIGWASDWNPSNRPVEWGYIPPSAGLAFTSNGDGTCYLSGIGTCTDTDIVIPSVSPEGDQVTSIGSRALQDCSSLTSIIIPSSVTSIGPYAFFGCSSLTDITIPESMTSIGNFAFQKCSSLTSVTIPNSVTTISTAAFSGCSQLTSITIPEGVWSIGSSAFSGCAGLTSITIPDSVTNIESSAFRSCSSLISITIPENVSIIGYNAFRDCDKLTIYAEAAEQPSGWHSSWNPSNRPVEWGYQPEA